MKYKFQQGDVVYTLPRLVFFDNANKKARPKGPHQIINRFKHDGDNYYVIKHQVDASLSMVKEERLHYRVAELAWVVEKDNQVLFLRPEKEGVENGKKLLGAPYLKERINYVD